MLTPKDAGDHEVVPSASGIGNFSLRGLSGAHRMAGDDLPL